MALDELGARNRAHTELLIRERYPSAEQCRNCHPDHYREWSVSSHAYAQLSPVFNAMQGTILKKTNGTLGDFCIRCHTPVGMSIGEPVFAPNADRSQVSREGVTCIVCHRVNQDFGKNSGRRSIEAYDIFAPVYGPRDGTELERVLRSDSFGTIVTEPGKLGRRIHREARLFEPITHSGFCGVCHDVTLLNFRLEEAFSEYKLSPAADRGESCQDCHMGNEPGIASGYRNEPAAYIGGFPTSPAKRTDHMFVGPDYSVVHPGIFPHSPEAQELASIEEWPDFDWRAGWGTEEFEDEVTDDRKFPERWNSVDDRYDAREIIEDQLSLIAEARERATQLLRRGYRLGDIEIEKAHPHGIEFRVRVENGTDGHNVPTGFVAERLVFLHVILTSASGEVVFESGDLDPNGDVRDLHSRYVHNGDLPLDDQLFNLQSKFITRNVRGGERESILSVNESLDPLPFLRPDTSASILTGRPQGVRIHKHSIEPNGHRWANYEVDASKLTGEGSYRLRVELIAGMVPVNLIGAIQHVGFDYGMSPREVADAVVEGHRILWEREIEIQIRNPR
jgi:nitrate/TMAO reductase-like tetraheme cytochrome c subunit